MAEDGVRGRGELSQRVISALVMAALALALAWLGGAPFFLIWLLLALAVSHEWHRIVAAPSPILSTAIVAATLVAGFVPLIAGMPSPLLLFFGCVILGAAVLAGFAREGHRIWTAAGLPYAAAVFMPTVLLRGMPGSEGAGQGGVAVLFLYAAVWSTDIGAYFAGRRFGGPKFAPRISPKKTWSGVVGGLVAGVAAALLLLVVAGYPVRSWHALVALLLGCAVVFGDLFESFIKRRFGVKDAGSLIPGHGGFMDRLDGYVFAVLLAAGIGLARGGLGDVAGGLLR